LNNGLRKKNYLSIEVVGVGNDEELEIDYVEKQLESYKPLDMYEINSYYTIRLKI
jgi:hypothetical protein